MRVDSEAGRHNFISKVVNVLMSHDLSPVFADEATRHFHEDGKALVHMVAPMTDETLVLRRVYAYPFWAIEASDKRWEWDVAKAGFIPQADNAEKAKRFVASWRKRLFGDARPKREGFVYIPLQGRICERRSFQAMSPLEMVKAAIEADLGRNIIVGLHPKEIYSADEIEALEKLEHQSPRVSIVMGQMERYLPNCDYVVSQNSAAAFFGYFFRKPAALFAHIDFHHIAANAHDLGAKEALQQAPDLTPDYEGYLWWFWQQMSINAGRPEAEARIAERFRKQRWIS